MKPREFLFVRVILVWVVFIPLSITNGNDEQVLQLDDERSRYEFRKELDAASEDRDLGRLVQLANELLELKIKHDSVHREEYIRLIGAYSASIPGGIYRVGSPDYEVVRIEDQLVVRALTQFFDINLELAISLAKKMSPDPKLKEITWDNERTKKTQLWFNILTRLAKPEEADPEIRPKRFRELQEIALLHSMNFFNIAYLANPPAPDEFRKLLAESNLPKSLRDYLTESVEVELLHYQKIILAPQKNVRKPKPGEPTWGEGRTDGLEFDEPYVPDPKEDSQGES